MAILAAQDVPVAGLDEITWSAAAGGGDQAPCGRDLVLLVRNADSGAHILTVATPGTVRGIPISDVAVTIAAGGTAVVPLAEVYRNRSTQRAALSYDGVTSVTVAVLRLPR